MKHSSGHHLHSDHSRGVKTKRTHRFNCIEEHRHHRRQKFSETKTLSVTVKSCSFRHNFSTSSRSNRVIRKKKHNHPRRVTGDPQEGRKWTFSSRDTSNYRDKIVFVSYNILGVENASKHPDLYLKVPPECLDWDRRKELICKEVNRYNAGVLCFQEVDRFNDLDGILKKDGFRGVYKARTGEARDGCAVFWKEKAFTLVHEDNIDFQSFGLRNNVAQLCVLKMNENQFELDLDKKGSKSVPAQNRCLVVGNIHVLFNPGRGDIKLGQVRLFLAKAHQLSQEWGGIPVLIGGDLNSIPQSAIYQYLVSSELDILMHDRRNISGQHTNFGSQSLNLISSRPSTYKWSEEEIRLATGNGGVTQLRHHLKLCSAYIGVPGSHRSRDSSGEPLATSYHSRFMGTVDYIWHTKELVPVRVLETLPPAILRSSVGLPDERWGSDHLALVCELAFADDHAGG